MHIDIRVFRYLVIPLLGVLAGWMTFRWMSQREISSDRIFGFRADRILFGLVMVGCVVLGGLVILRYTTWHSSYYDLGAYDQKIWLISEQTDWWGMLEQSYKGGVMVSPCGTERFWGICHFQPILLVPALLYQIWASPLAPLAFQVLVVVSGIIPALLLARDHFGTPVAGVAASTLFLVYPAVQFNGVLDFRPDHVAIPILLWAYFLAGRGQHLASLGVAGIGGLMKEPLILSFAFFGLYLAFQYKRWALGLVSFVFGLTAFYFLSFHLLTSGGQTEGQFMIGRYFPDLSGPSGVVPRLLGDPVGFLRHVAQPHKVVYMAALFAPLAFLPLFSPIRLIPAIPFLGISLLSSFPGHASFQSQHSASVVGPAFAALFISIRWLGDKYGRRAAPVPILAGLVVLSGCISFALGPTPLSVNFWDRSWGGVWHYTQYLPDRQATVNQAAKLIPAHPDKVVVTQNGLNAARLAHRHQYYPFPDALDRADYVFLDTGRLPYVYWNIDRERYRRLVRRLLRSRDYKVIFDEHGVLVLERRQASDARLTLTGCPETDGPSRCHEDRQHMPAMVANRNEQ